MAQDLELITPITSTTTTVVSHLNLNFSLKSKPITSLALDRSHPHFDLNEAQPPSSVVKPSRHHHDGGSQSLIVSLSKPKPNTSYLSDLSLSLKPRT